MPTSGAAGTATPALSADELVKRLQLHSPLLVEELYEIARAQIKVEERRGEAIEAKGSVLLGQSGLALAVAGGLGGVLAQAPRAQRIFEGSGRYELGAFVVTLVVGGAATFVTLLAGLVRESRLGVDESVVFDQGGLFAGDDPAQEQGLASYRRLLTAHLWQIQQRYFARNEATADRVKCAQILFMVFIGAITILGALVTYQLATTAAEVQALVSPTPVASPSPAPSAASQDASAPAVAARPEPPPATSVPPGGRLQKLTIDPPKGTTTGSNRTK
jgi:hypothetical protein